MTEWYIPRQPFEPFGELRWTRDHTPHVVPVAPFVCARCGKSRNAHWLGTSDEGCKFVAVAEFFVMSFFSPNAPGESPDLTRDL